MFGSGQSLKSRTKSKINFHSTYTLESTSRSRLKSSNLISPSNFENRCPGGKLCQNYQLLIDMEFQIKKLIQTIQQLTRINNYFSFNIGQKEKMYKLMLDENMKIKNGLYTKFLQNTLKEQKVRKFIIPESLKFNLKELQNNSFESNNKNDDESLESEKKNDDEEIKIEKKPLKTFKKMKTMSVRHTTAFDLNKIDFAVKNSNLKEKLNNNEDDKITDKSESPNRKNLNKSKKKVQIIVDCDSNSNRRNTSKLNISNDDNSDNIIERERKERFQTERRERKNIDRNNKEEKERENLKKHLKKNPYDEIIQISQRTQKHNLQNSTGISFLALSDSALNEMISNPNIIQLYKITLDDDIFINELQTSEKDTMNRYCDIIGTMCKDFRSSINLIQRIKSFLEATVALVGSVENGHSISILIKNTCKILNCDRASLFIHDRITDMLVVHSAEGLKKNQIKVPKNKGVVGAVFMTGEKLKIDNAYQDMRFNKEVDRKTGYKTRNIMCYPLIDNDGDIFGAIQAINKLGSKDASFDNNDEELLGIFSKQASAILKNEININEYYIQINRLKIVHSFSIKISSIHNINEFIDEVENCFNNIFELSTVQILFNVGMNYLYEVKQQKFLGYNNLGIAYYVFNNKIVHSCPKIKNCKFFNVLVDLDGNDALVTYPIINQNNNQVLAILQVACNIKVSEASEKLKQNEMLIFKMIDESICNWIIKNDNEIEKLREKNKKLCEQYSNGDIL